MLNIDGANRNDVWPRVSNPCLTLNLILSLKRLCLTHTCGAGSVGIGAAEKAQALLAAADARDKACESYKQAAVAYTAVVSASSHAVQCIRQLH